MTSAIHPVVLHGSGPRAGAARWSLLNFRERSSFELLHDLNGHGAVLLPAFLPPLLERARSSPGADAASDLATMIRREIPSASGDLYAKVHREVDRLLFTLSLQHTGGNHRDAARLLGISRQTMRVKLRALGISVTQVVEEHDEST